MKDFNLKKSGPYGLAKSSCLRMKQVRIAVSALILLTAFAATPKIISHAQKIYAPLKISNITTQTSGTRSVVTIAADNSVARPQTWQDEEGFHVVLPNTVSAESIKPSRGVKIRRIGSSLEILAQTKPGSRVSVTSSHNELNLIIDGTLDARPTDTAFRLSPSSSEERQLFEDPKNYSVRNDLAPLPELTTDNPSAGSRPAQVQTSQTISPATPVASPVTEQNPLSSSSNQIVAQGDDTSTPLPIRVHVEDESVLSSIFSGTSVFIVFALGLFGLLVSRKMRSRHNLLSTKSSAPAIDETIGTDEQPNLTTAENGNQSLARLRESSAPAKRQPVTRVSVAGPASLYGAYRIDQEVGKLTLGQPHRIDVLASRASDDRRAIETSLIKAVNSTSLDEKAQCRAREALEEYGFVARQCASLLLAPDAYERSSAARSLGEIKSASALPFLLEGLYDSESIVRNQAVMSIGELKLPSAIGALLDIARTHPDVPNSLLSRTLSACSVEGLDFFDAIVPESSLLGPGDVGSIIEEITHLAPSNPIESLPEGSDDEVFVHALALVDSDDLEKRAEALKTLVQFRVQSAVDAISSIARHDPECTIRSLAISSLGSISHESVFATVLIGMADESREVRAAAARSVSRLSFDRADAYVRVIETSDEETRRSVAQACVQAGIVSQNLDRLSNADHRQAYETFALICLLTEAKVNQPVLDAILSHPRTDVRLKAVHLLGRTGHPDAIDQLRALAVEDNIGEVVKTAILEALYKLDQNKKQEHETIDEFAVEHHSQTSLESDSISALLAPEFEPEMIPTFDLEAHSEADEFER